MGFVKQHPRIGQVILDEAGGLPEAGKIILHHHERFGGHGYPHGLGARDIPLGSRIVSIADAYDAMIQDRPYKRAISHDEALTSCAASRAPSSIRSSWTYSIACYAAQAPIADRRPVARPGQQRLRPRAAERSALSA